MQPIQGFEQVQAIHGRQGALPGGAYVAVVVRAKEDTTGYGNQCLKVVYDICEGQYAGRFADIAADPEQDWRHVAEIDLQEANGARLKALVEAVQASNPGYVWDWNEQGLVGRVFGLVLQERKVTVSRGKNKGKDRTYLDFWDAVPVDIVRAGKVPTPPVNDKREKRGDDPDAPVAVPPSYNAAPTQQAPVAPAPAPMPQQPYQQPVAPPMAPPAAPQYGQPMQQPYQQPQVPPQQPMAMADSDIPF